jgi:hypothetical protein
VKTNVELTIERSEYKNLTTVAEEMIKRFKGQKTPSEVPENEHSLVETSIRNLDLSRITRKYASATWMTLFAINAVGLRVFGRTGGTRTH